MDVVINRNFESWEEALLRNKSIYISHLATSLGDISFTITKSDFEGFYCNIDFSNCVFNEETNKVIEKFNEVKAQRPNLYLYIFITKENSKMSLRVASTTSSDIEVQ